MLSEIITVTTTPTSIQQLIATAREVDVDEISYKGTGIMLRYSASETAVVTLSDSGSTAGAVVLDAATEELISTNFPQLLTALALLSCDAGTVDVHLIITRNLG